MNSIVANDEMLTTKEKIDNIHLELTNNMNEINTNFDKVVSNWAGSKSKVILAPVENIKNENKKILEKIKEKSDQIKRAYDTYLKAQDTTIVQSTISSNDTLTDNSEKIIEKPEDVILGTTLSPADSIPTEPKNQDLTPSDDKLNEVRSNYIYNMDSSGNYSRVINYQGASWNYFTMRDPLWSNWQLNRNKTGFKPLAKNGSHPFATINIFANSGLIAGKKEDIVIDVLGVSGIQTKVDGKNVGDGILNLTTGQHNMGGQHKYKTILKSAGIPSSILPTLDNAITELEKGNVIHCLAQEGSSIAKLGHYLTLVGVEKNNNGAVTGLYVLDSIGKSQSEFDSISKKSNSSELVHVIEPGLVRIDASKENLKDVKLASFRSIDGGKSITKTVFSYEDYLNGNY